MPAARSHGAHTRPPSTCSRRFRVSVSHVSHVSILSGPSCGQCAHTEPQGVSPGPGEPNSPLSLFLSVAHVSRLASVGSVVRVTLRAALGLATAITAAAGHLIAPYVSHASRNLSPLVPVELARARARVSRFGWGAHSDGSRRGRHALRGCCNTDIATDGDACLGKRRNVIGSLHLSDNRG